MKRIKGLLLLAAISAVVWQCAQDEVYMSNQNAVQIGLASIYTMTDSTVDKFSAYGLNRTDSIYARAQTKVAFLPLRFDSDTTVFVLQTYLRRDTMAFIHTKEQTFVSSDDGFAFNLQLKAIYYTTNFIDSVVITNPSINYNENIQNVKIYLH